MYMIYSDTPVISSEKVRMLEVLWVLTDSNFGGATTKVPLPLRLRGGSGVASNFSLAEAPARADCIVTLSASPSSEKTYGLKRTPAVSSSGDSVKSSSASVKDSSNWVSLRSSADSSMISSGDSTSPSAISSGASSSTAYAISSEDAASSGTSTSPASAISSEPDSSHSSPSSME